MSITITPEVHLKLLIRTVLQFDSALGVLGLHCAPAIEKTGPAVAWATKKSIHFREDFFTNDYTHEQRLFIVAHEILHVALQHVYRGAVYYRRTGMFSPDLWNLAADALINHTIKEQWNSTPPDATTYDKFSVFLKGQSANKKIQDWTLESLYEELVKNAKLITIGMPNDLQGNAENDDKDQNGKNRKQQFVMSEEELAEAKKEAAEWRVRVEAIRGSNPGSLLRKIEDIGHKSVVPWEALITDFMCSILKIEPYKSWRKFNRTTRTFEGEYGFYPGMQRNSPSKRMGFVFDTSGSIDNKILSVFRAEVNKVLSITGAEAVCIDADADVAQVVIVKGKLPEKLQHKGGGGTDFRPALREFEKHKVDGVIYLTDLAGTFPEKKPPFPVLWASTVNGDKAPEHLGKTVYLEPRG